MSALNVEKIRKDFPILNRKINGKPLVYLDSAATTQKPEAVITALANFYRTHNANIHRGVYALAEESTSLYEATRGKVARFLNAPGENNIVFTRNTTESINLIAHAWARKFLFAGDEILLTVLEHHSNFVPWYLLAKEKGVKIKVAPINENHELDMEAFARLLTPQVKLVAITAVSNALGTIVPLPKIIEWAHANGSLVAVDGAQSAPHMPVDLKELGCDFFSFSAHKMLGPTGVGVLWAKEEILAKMNPFLGGGEMINTVSEEETTWADLPHKFEAGTPNFADVAAFGAGLDYLSALGMDNVRRHEKEIVAYALKRLGQNPELIVYGPADPEKRGGVISFNHRIIHPHDVGTILDAEGVSIRAGHHCAQPLMKTLGVAATARASFYIYNTLAEVDALASALSRVDEVFGFKKAAQLGQK